MSMNPFREDFLKTEQGPFVSKKELADFGDPIRETIHQAEVLNDFNQTQVVDSLGRPAFPAGASGTMIGPIPGKSHLETRLPKQDTLAKCVDALDVPLTRLEDLTTRPIDPSLIPEKRKEEAAEKWSAVSADVLWARVRLQTLHNYAALNESDYNKVDPKEIREANLGIANDMIHALKDYHAFLRSAGVSELTILSRAIPKDIRLGVQTLKSVGNIPVTLSKGAMNMLRGG